jgi:hypothetical protein
MPASKIIGGNSLERGNLKKIWDSCKVKDMAFEDFVSEMNKLADPIEMARDLAKFRNMVRK